MDFVERYFDIEADRKMELSLGLFDEYIDRVSRFRPEDGGNVKITFDTPSGKIHVYYIEDTIERFYGLLQTLHHYPMVKWNHPPLNFDRLYSVLIGSIEVYTFGVFAGEKRSFMITYYERGFKIEDYFGLSL